MKYCALTIAGSDSGGGAGIQADLKTFAALGVYGTSAVTAVTAQNSLGVQAVRALDGAIVRSQIEAVLTDIPVGAIKIGMLLNEEIIAAVADVLAMCKNVPLVVDTVMVSTSGRHLLLPEAVAVFKQRILPLADVVTPNLPEAEALTGLTVDGRPAMIEAARQLHAMGAGSVIVKGGHLPSSEIVDILFDGRKLYEFTAPRLNNIHTHGTGCTFSSAVAAYLARGCQLPEAVGQARAYMNMAIKNGFPLGGGIGPLHHFQELYERAGIFAKKS